MNTKLNNYKSKVVFIFTILSLLTLISSNVSSFVDDTTPPAITEIGHYPIYPRNTDPVLFNCSAYDISGIQSVTLYYRVNEGSWIDVLMLKVGATTTYEYTSGLFEPNDNIEYYITAVDASSNHNSATDNNGGSYYLFLVEENDITGPEITNVSFLPAIPNNSDKVTVNCIVIDDYNGISDVIVHYRVNGSMWAIKLFDHISDNNYQTEIGSFDANVIVEFYISASDDSENANIGINNNSGLFFSFNVILNTTEINPIPCIVPIIAIVTIGIIIKRRK
ncbi:MAG: hypothetical protein JXA54_12430 [Candidatus Heimdallarchaeota archaeon]|nr:hypothetical protein [Candidatus Heimdallarchaeota archaeon]